MPLLPEILLQNEYFNGKQKQKQKTNKNKKQKTHTKTKKQVRNSISY